MGGGAAAVQQTGLGEQERPGAVAGQIGAAGPLARAYWREAENRFELVEKTTDATKIRVPFELKQLVSKQQNQQRGWRGA